MQAHVPNQGGLSQLQVLASSIDRVFLSIDELVMTPLTPAEREPLFARLTELRMLWQTFEVLAGNFEQAGGQAIGAISRLEYDGFITAEAANELMAPFSEALGDMYTDAMAALPE